jgi:hypothetical protein
MDVSGRMGIKKLSEGEKQTGRDGSDFRVEIVGSNPAGLTTKPTDPIACVYIS